jgi:hypothetical protein
VIERIPDSEIRAPRVAQRDPAHHPRPPGGRPQDPPQPSPCMSAPPERPTPRGSGKPRPDTYGCNSLVREVVHASRATGQDDHLKALTSTTDVQRHAVRRAGTASSSTSHNPAGKAGGWLPLIA